MSKSNETSANNLSGFLNNEKGWADFFITRIGLILFASILLLSALKVYPMFQEKEEHLELAASVSDIASKIEASDSTTIPGYKYNYNFNEKKNVRIEISTEFVSAGTNISTGTWGERKIIHARPLVTHVYPPNNNWSNTSGFREYVSRVIANGSSGDEASPLNLSRDKKNVDSMFESIKKELSRSPFLPDTEKPLIIEKVIIYYKNQADKVERDYVFIYQ